MNHRANATTLAIFGLLLVLLCGFNVYQTRNLQDQIAALQGELAAARQEVTALKTEVQTLSAQARNPLSGLGGGLGDLSQLITPEMLQQALPLAQKMLEQMGAGTSGGPTPPPAEEVPAPPAE